jgi:hypothetical protein
VLSSVIPLARFLDSDTVFQCPPLQSRHGFEKRSSERRQFIVDPRRDGRFNGPLHQAVPLESAQCKREHTLRHAIDTSPEFTEALGAVLQERDRQNAPFVPNSIQDLANRGTTLTVGNTAVTE